MTYLFTCDQGERQHLLQEFDQFFADKGHHEVATYYKHKSNLNDLLTQLNFTADKKTRQDARSILRVIHADKIAQKALQDKPIVDTVDFKHLSGKDVAELTKEVNSNEKTYNIATYIKTACKVSAWGSFILLGVVGLPLSFAGVPFVTLSFALASITSSFLGLIPEWVAGKAHRNNIEPRHELCVLKRANAESEREKLFAHFNERVLKNDIDDEKQLNSDKVMNLFTEWCGAQPSRSWQERLWRVSCAL